MQMDVVFADHSTNDFHVLCLAYLNQEFPATRFQFSGQYRIPIFRRPHDIHSQAANRVMSNPLNFHSSIVATPC